MEQTKPKGDQFDKWQWRTLRILRRVGGYYGVVPYSVMLDLYWRDVKPIRAVYAIMSDGC